MYVIDYKKQIERINEMVTLRKNMDTLEVYYHDPSTGELWKSFFPRDTKKGNGPKLLRPEPLPEDLELQLEMCLNSKDKNDALGLGIELSVNPQKWPAILDLLEKNRKKYLRSNLFTFLKHSGLLNPFGSLEEIGQKPGNYGLTSSKLQTIRKRAKKLRLKRFFGL